MTTMNRRAFIGTRVAADSGAVGATEEDTMLDAQGKPRVVVVGGGAGGADATAARYIAKDSGARSTSP